jgi:glycine C-acetyltransferase
VKSLQVALKKVADGDDRRQAMWDRSNELKDGLRNLGYHIGTGDSPICAVFTPVGENLEEVGMQMLTYLRQHKIFCTGVMWPVIPPGLVMFRMIPTAAHSKEDVARTVEVFKAMRDDLKVQFPLNDDLLSRINKIFRD